MKKKVWIIISLIIVFGVFVSIFGQNSIPNGGRFDGILKRIAGHSLFYTSDLPVTRTDIALDTVVTITVYGVGEENIQEATDNVDKEETPSVYDNVVEEMAPTDLVDTAFDMIKDYEKKFSAYETDSEIYMLNHANGAEVEISEDTYELLQKGLYYSELSEGRFDITCGALNELWHMSDNDGFVPEQDDIERALSTIDYKKVDIKKCEKADETEIAVANDDEEVSKISNEEVSKISNEEVSKISNKEASKTSNKEASKTGDKGDNRYKYYARINDSASKIDLGAIAKGFIGDKVKEYLVSQGVNSAIINLGGNVVLIGGKITENSWFSDKNKVENFNIGIPKPFEIDKIEFAISEKDKTIVTSGNYQRYFEKDGKIYHHIMDLTTGYPTESGVSSVSIVCDSSVDADALSTICFILGKNDGEKFLQKNIPDAKVYWIE